jgi:hypothetical protein
VILTYGFADAVHADLFREKFGGEKFDPKLVVAGAAGTGCVISLAEHKDNGFSVVTRFLLEPTRTGCDLRI